MTREDFLHNSEAWDWDDLFRFCSDFDLHAVDDIIECDDLDERICEDIREEMAHSYWYNIADDLNEIERNGSYYYREGRLQYTVVDGDLASYISDAFEEMDRYDMWDPEEEDEDEEDYSSLAEACEEERGEEDISEPAPETPEFGVFSLSDLLSDSRQVFETIRERKE